MGSEFGLHRADKDQREQPKHGSCFGCMALALIGAVLSTVVILLVSYFS